MDLPQFKYHPNAYKLDVFKKSKKVCQCCGQARGMIYECSFYCTANVDALCPWCIHDGSAAKKFDGQFQSTIEPPDGDFSKAPALNADIVHELMCKTPSYVSWQGSYWLTHCDDGCEFHGDVQENELLSLPQATLALFQKEHDYLFSPKNWGSLEAFNEIYFPAGDIALYKFVCRHCGFIRLHCDMS
jgi:uncharacterized protein